MTPEEIQALEFSGSSDLAPTGEKKPPVSELEFTGVGEFPKPLSGSQTVPVRSMTPGRMADILEQKMLPAIYGEQKQAEASRQQRSAEAEWETKNLSPDMKKALALTGSAAETGTAGLFPYIPAALAKGAGKLGVSGYEQYADMPMVDVKKAAERKISGASTLEPGYALTGNIAGLIGGTKTMPTIAPARGPAISGGLTGGTYGAISGGAAEGDIGDAVKGAVVGTLGGAVAAPVLERTASGLMRLFTGGKPVVTPSGALTEEAITAARAAGLTDQEITTLTPQLRQTFEQRGVTPAAAAEAPFREFGIQPTRGMVTGEAAQLEREARFGNYAPQAEQAAEAARTVAGGAQPSVRDAVSAAVEAGNRQAEALRRAYTQAYAVAENTPGTFTRESISNLGDRIMQGLAGDPRNLSIIGNDAARAAANKLDTVLGAAIPAGPGVSVIHRTFQGVEAGRKLLNESLGAATNNGDRRAIRRLIDEFDQRIEQNINNGAFSGNPNVVEDWRAARRLYSEYQGRFGVRKTGEDAGQLMRSVLDGNKNADDVGNAMFNFASSGDADLKRQAIKTMLQLRRALGPNSPELEDIKRSYIQQVMTPRRPAGANEAATGAADFSRVATNIDQMLTGKGAEFSRRLLTDPERNAMVRYADVMRRAGQLPPAEAATNLGAWRDAALTIAPTVVGAAAAQLAQVDPTLATVLSVPGAVRLIKGTRPVQTYLANRPPENVARSYRFPETRTAIPLATQAAPDISQSYKDIHPEEATGGSVGRTARASGGKVAHNIQPLVSRLMGLAEQAKRSTDSSTKPLLDAPDASIVKALRVANQAI